MTALVASGWADGFLPVTMSFAVLRVTGSVARLGLLLAVQSGVALLLTLAGGLAGDRFSRTRIMIASLAIRTATASVIAVTLLTGMASYSLLLAMAGVTAVLTASSARRVRLCCRRSFPVSTWLRPTP